VEPTCIKKVVYLPCYEILIIMNAYLMGMLKGLIERKQLPKDYFQMVEEHMLPLAAWLALRKQDKPLVVGINGAQGCGKSTMAEVLAMVLKHIYGFNVATLSLDDLYLTHDQRLKLAQEVHPLLQTRGVPGTHDVQLGLDTLQQLITGQGEVLLPSFDKRLDDRKPQEQWLATQDPVDIVLFEGWCVATPAQAKEDLFLPINALESLEDQDGVWRDFVNHALADQYQILFDMIDALIFLKTPSFDVVKQWRGKQEQQTFDAQPERGMNPSQLNRFIQHYQRLTMVSLKELPKLADVIFELDDGQNVIHTHYK